MKPLPLYAEERDIAEQVLGRGHLREWEALVPVLERKGFPPIDALFGRRNIRAVFAWFDRYAKVNTDYPGIPDGEDRPWTRKRKRRDSAFASAPTATVHRIGVREPT